MDTTGISSDTLAETTKARIFNIISALSHTSLQGRGTVFRIPGDIETLGTTIDADWNAFISDEMELDSEMINQDIKTCLDLGIMTIPGEGEQIFLGDISCVENWEPGPESEKLYSIYRTSDDFMIVRQGDTPGSFVMSRDSCLSQFGISFAMSDSMEHHFPEFVRSVHNKGQTTTLLKSDIDAGLFHQMSENGLIRDIEGIHTGCPSLSIEDVCNRISSIQKEPAISITMPNAFQG